MNDSRRAVRAGILAALAPALLTCSGANPGGPTDGAGTSTLDLVSPASGEQVATDSPTFTVRNARSLDAGQAEYTFEVVTASAFTVLASTTVPAGSGTTSASLGVLPRGMRVAWRVTARGGGATSVSETRPFRMPAVECGPLRHPFAKSVVDWSVPACSLAGNAHNDPRDAVGAPNATNQGGFISLGEGGHVILDMEGCAGNGVNADVRVYQITGSEPVTLYAGGTALGPWRLLEARKRCGDRLPDVRSGYCEFDLGEIDEARYFKIEDGELFPCERAGTDTEGADIDAIEILNAR